MAEVAMNPAVAQQTQVTGKRPQDTGEYPPAKRPRIESATVIDSVAVVNAEDDQALQSVLQELGLTELVNTERECTLRLLVPSGAVGSIIGKGGATIRAIMDRSGSVIRVRKADEAANPAARDPSITSSSVVEIEGKINNNHVASQMISNLVYALSPINTGEDFFATEHDCQFLIPECMTGMIIGKGGASIKSIIEKSQTRTRIKQVHPPTAYSMNSRGNVIDESLVSSYGLPDKFRIVQYVLTVKVEDEREKNPPQPSAAPRMPYGGGAYAPPPPRRPAYGDRGEESSMFTIPPEMVGEIIGRGGATVQQINHQSGARVHISKDNAPGTNEKAVTITGTRSQIEHARELITTRLAHAMSGQPTPPPSLYGGGAALGMGAMGMPAAMAGPGGATEDTLRIAAQAVGEIIGKGGATIKDLCAQSGAKIHISTDDVGNGEREVTFVGSAQACAVAKDMVINRLTAAGHAVSGAPSSGAAASAAAAAAAQYAAYYPGYGAAAAYGGAAAPAAAGYEGWAAPAAAQQAWNAQAAAAWPAYQAAAYAPQPPPPGY